MPRAILVAAVLLSALSAEAKRKGASDIEVQLTLPSGKTIAYSSEVRTIELLLDPSGQLRMIHLVLARRGEEKDTHEWYNFAQLSGFSYTYISVTGRAKVRVKRIEPFGLVEAPKDKVPAINVDDYR